MTSSLWKFIKTFSYSSIERERELYKNENELRRKQTTYGQNKKSDRLMTNK
jgi:hypothetical protein